MTDVKVVDATRAVVVKPIKAKKPFPVRELVVALIILACLVPLLFTFATSPELDWNAVGEYLFAGLILEGVVITIVLSVVPMAIGGLLAVVIVLFSFSGMRTLRLVAHGYIWIFRAIPLLVQLIFWFNLGLVIPTITVGIPWTDFNVTYLTNALISGLMAALLGLTLHETAVIAEIYRGGITGVSIGQMEAAQAMGLTRSSAIRRIVFPQAIRSVVPALGNVFIGLLKATSLVSVIGAGDLLTNTQRIYAGNFEVIPLLIVATLWYMLLTAVFSLGQAWLEKWMDSTKTKVADAKVKTLQVTEVA